MFHHKGHTVFYGLCVFTDVPSPAGSTVCVVPDLLLQAAGRQPRAMCHVGTGGAGEQGRVPVGFWGDLTGGSPRDVAQTDSHASRCLIPPHMWSSAVAWGSWRPLVQQQGLVCACMV